jgi:hypothetical protein
MKSSPYVISHSCFLFCTLLFRGEVINFLHLFLSFNGSIYFTFISFDRNFNCVKTQISVLVPLHTLSAVLIFFKFEMKNYLQFCLCVIMAVSVLSINVVTLLFINWAVLLKRCFTGINTSLCERIVCAGEESVGLYGQICTVKHPPCLIWVNLNSDKSNNTIVYVRVCCGYVYDAVDLISSVFSIHTLVLMIFILIIFIFDNCYGVVEVIDVNKGSFVSYVYNDDVYWNSS